MAYDLPERAARLILENICLNVNCNEDKHSCLLGMNGAAVWGTRTAWIRVAPANVNYC